jgi:hypothetical protein
LNKLERRLLRLKNNVPDLGIFIRDLVAHVSNPCKIDGRCFGFRHLRHGIY